MGNAGCFGMSMTFSVTAVGEETSYRCLFDILVAAVAYVHTSEFVAEDVHTWKRSIRVLVALAPEVQEIDLQALEMSCTIRWARYDLLGSQKAIRGEIG